MLYIMVLFFHRCTASNRLTSEGHRQANNVSGGRDEQRHCGRRQRQRFVSSDLDITSADNTRGYNNTSHNVNVRCAHVLAAASAADVVFVC